jgi:hypothetical protein
MFDSKVMINIPASQEMNRIINNDDLFSLPFGLSKDSICFNCDLSIFNWINAGVSSIQAGLRTKIIECLQSACKLFAKFDKKSFPLGIILLPAILKAHSLYKHSAKFVYHSIYDTLLNSQSESLWHIYFMRDDDFMIQNNDWFYYSPLEVTLSQNLLKELCPFVKLSLSLIMSKMIGKEQPIPMPFPVSANKMLDLEVLITLFTFFSEQEICLLSNQYLDSEQFVFAQNTSVDSFLSSNELETTVLEYLEKSINSFFQRDLSNTPRLIANAFFQKDPNWMFISNLVSFEMDCKIYWISLDRFEEYWKDILKLGAVVAFSPKFEENLIRNGPEIGDIEEIIVNLIGIRNPFTVKETALNLTANGLNSWGDLLEIRTKFCNGEKTDNINRLIHYFKEARIPPFVCAKLASYLLNS